MSERKVDDFLVFGAPRLGEAAIAEVVDSLRSGWIGTGPKVARFEDTFRRYADAPHAVAVSSCSAALHLSLLVAGVGPGDEVITTPMTFCATVNAILHVGARPVLVDCDRRTQLIDPGRVEDAIGPATRAILPIHFAGRPCDLDALGELARRHDLRLIEYAAHAIDARCRGRKIGSAADLTCFSINATKNLTTGEGGMVTTASAEWAEALRVWRMHGQSRGAWDRSEERASTHYHATVPGFKYNMTDLQAALGIHQLAALHDALARREAIWKRYDDGLADLPLELPAPAEADTVHARHLYTVMVDPDRAGVGRDAFAARLREQGVGSGVHYVGVHLQPYHRRALDVGPESFPNATWISERTVSLPLSPTLEDADVERVIGAVRRVLGATHGT